MCVQTQPFCWQHFYVLLVSVMASRLLIWTYSNFEGSRGPIGRPFSTSKLSPMSLGYFRVEE